MGSNTMAQNFIWRALEHLSNNQFDVTKPADYHFQRAERFFKFVSWILATAALTFAASSSQNVILWALCLYGYFRLFYAFTWHSITIPGWFGPTDFSPKKGRTILLQVTVRLLAFAISLYCLFRFQDVISGILTARCAK